MKKRALTDVKLWAEKLVPESLKEGLIIDIREVVCGDPSCAPVDTVFTLVWENGGRGVFAVPLVIEEIQPEDVDDIFPDEDCLSKWKAGIKCDWPPKPPLRFGIGERVECRIGPHPVKGWAAGRIIKLHYSESDWPPNMVAPYQIQLHDGRLIYAPADVDQVIRLRPPAQPNDPPSPEVQYPNDEDDEDYDENVEDMDDGSGNK
eukprot:CAMPEP_0196764712 /NCGR_PEP_ID=MMETSP1095-20130614/6696_1 /TAXON_ID=96789 ORGANISM="Chromulina nebulosa, Strain UTEXLB2642" /NCGR_SAMPLE_ID=MMETSP1095 /ASSEMBLY_ACC=CAM_ASM_000446 /LENGTH=203 /DNA_ID=CAMNT_0042120959 /DNA_START=319 /DNA_END=930 /DNA_ORIENTATION=+